MTTVAANVKEAESVFRALLDRLVEHDRASTAADPGVIRKSMWDYGVEAIVESVDRDVLRTGTGQKRVALMMHSFMCTIVDKARTSLSLVFPLYEMFSDLITSYLTIVATRTREGFRGPMLLEEVGRRWLAHRLINEWLARVFRKVDPAWEEAFFRIMCGTQISLYEAKHPDAKPFMFPALRSVGVRLFKSVFFDSMKADIIDVIQQQADRDRSGEPINRGLLKQTIDMILVMGVCDGKEMSTMKNADALNAVINNPPADTNRLYVEEFETQFIERTLNFYRPLVSSWISGSVASYLALVEDALNKEDGRCRAYVNTSTRRKLMHALRTMMLAEKSNEIIGNEATGIMFMFRASYRAEASGTEEGKADAEFDSVSDPKRDLARMFSLFSGPGEEGIPPVDTAIVTMGTSFQDFLVECGVNISRNRKDRAAAGTGTGAPKPPPMNDPEYVKSLISLLSQAKWLLKNAFKDHLQLGKGLLRGMEKVLNSDRENPEIIATFLDHTLQGKGVKEKLNDAAISSTVEETLGLIRYVVDQDVFLEHYLSLLSKRLLLNKMNSIHSEEEAVGKMKAMFGPSFTQRISSLITNYKVVTDAQKVENYPVGTGGETIEFRMLPLQLSCWPPFQLFESVVLPSDMAICKTRYHTKYENENPNYNLKWVFGQGSATVRVVFNSGWKNLVVTSLQAVVLLTMGKYPSLKIRDLSAQTGIPIDVLKRVVGSMCQVPQNMVMKKDPKGPKINDDDSVLIDYAFASPKREFSLPVPSLGDARRLDEGSKDSDDPSLPPEIVNGRNLSIQAAVVRIMKARREPMEHRDLTQETMRQIQLFRPTERHIKRVIAELINLEYIKRVNPDVHTSPYVYVPE